MLVLLVSGQRIQTLTLLDIRNMSITPGVITFTVLDLLKQSRPGYKNPPIILKAFPDDRTVCVYSYLREYLARTESLRSTPCIVFDSAQTTHTGSEIHNNSLGENSHETCRQTLNCINRIPFAVQARRL